MTPSHKPSRDARGWWVIPLRHGVRRQEHLEFQHGDRYDDRVVRQMARLGAGTVYQDRTRTFISLHPKFCPPEVAAETLEVARRGVPPYHLRYYLDGWAVRRLDSVPELEDALQFILALDNVRALPRPLQITPVKVEAGKAHGKLRDVIANPCNHENQMVVFAIRGERFFYDAIGPDALVTSLLGEDWRQQTIGAPHDNGLADRKFDRKTSEAYAWVAKTRQPHTSRVSGLMKTSGGGIYQNYLRTIVYIDGSAPRVASLSQLAGDAGPLNLAAG